MVTHTPKSSSSKAQFFLLSAFVISTCLLMLSRYIQPGSVLDTSRVVMKDEFFVFDNIKEKARETVRLSKSCEELKYNLEEFKIFAEEFASDIGSLSFSYRFLSPCNLNGKDVQTTIEFNLTLVSPSVKLNSVFNQTWSP